MSSEEPLSLSSNPSSKNSSEEANEESSEIDLQTTEDDDEKEEEINVSSSEGYEDTQNDALFEQSEAQNLDYLEMYNKKCQECFYLNKQNETLKAKVNAYEKKIYDQQESIEKLISINEQIMRDKEIMYRALQKINNEKTNLENEINLFKYIHFSQVDTNLSYSSPTKDIKVINVSFDKYLYIKYNTTKPLGIICLFNEQKQARVLSTFEEKTEQLSLEEYLYYQPHGRGNALKVKDGEQILSLTSIQNELITISQLPPLFDRFHKVSQTSSFFVGKKEYFMTSIDLSTIDKYDPSHELRAFGVIFETEINQKKPGMVDVYDDYLEMFRQINRGVIISYVSSFEFTTNVFMQITRESITKPINPPKNGMMYVESKVIKIEKYHIPFLFPVPYLNEETYSIAFYISEYQDKCHIIDVI